MSDQPPPLRNTARAHASCILPSHQKQQTRYEVATRKVNPDVQSTDVSSSPELQIRFSQIWMIGAHNWMVALPHVSAWTSILTSGISTVITGSERQFALIPTADLVAGANAYEYATPIVFDRHQHSSDGLSLAKHQGQSVKFRGALPFRPFELYFTRSRWAVCLQGRSRTLTLELLSYPIQTLRHCFVVGKYRWACLPWTKY